MTSDAPTLADVLAELKAVRALVARPVAAPPAARLLPAGAAAAYLGLGLSTFYRGVAQGELPDPLRATGHPRWDVRALDRYADAVAQRRRPRRKKTTPRPTDGGG